MIAPGEDIRADDFINESEIPSPQSDAEGKVPKLEDDGKVDLNLINTGLRMTAGEDLAENDAVYLSRGANATVNQNLQNASDTISGTDWRAQTFTMPISGYIKSVRVSLGTGTPTVACSIRATSGDLPTGSDLSSIEQITSTGEALYTFTFANKAFAQANTVMAFIVRSVSGTVDLLNQNTNVYSGGRRCTSANSGSSWTGTSTDIRFLITIETEEGKIYRTTAVGSSGANTKDNETFLNFIGFTNKAVSKDGVVPLTNFGIKRGLTGLTIGADYYLSNTFGEINSSAGSNSFKVGKAISATDLLIKIS